MKFPKISIRILLFLEGLISIAVSSYLATSTYSVHLSILGIAVTVAQRNFSLMSIFLGLFLVILGALSTSKTRPLWYLSIVLILLDVSVFLFSFERGLYIPLLGAGLAVAIMYMLFRRRYEYVEPSYIITDPRLAVSFIIVAFTAAYGIGGSLLLGQDFNPPITSIGNAIYYTGETVTTLGFGDIVPITLSARLFTVSLSVLGLAVFFGSLTLLITPIIEKRIGGVTTAMEKMGIQSLRNYILVCGYSPIIAKYLLAAKESGQTVAVVENNEANFQNISDSGYLLVKGDPDDEEILSLFQLEQSKMVIIGASEDSRNLLISAALSQLIKSDEVRRRVSVLVNLPRNSNKFSGFGFNIVDISEIVKDALARGS
ncbi:MAG TPA: NAD-binding protein [Thermoplasmataceae archaeon]|nr:NAD-binding protein [Thermoplasmataceae archaeon]